MNKELSNMNLILYHGSPVDFDEFTNDGLGVEKEQGMAVTAGYYFTNNFEEAKKYAGENGFVYEIKLNLDLEYKANNEPEYVTKEVIVFSQEEIDKQLKEKGKAYHKIVKTKSLLMIDYNNNLLIKPHQNVTAKKIIAILKKKKNWKEKLLDYEDIDITKSYQVENALRNVANIYYERFKYNYVDGLNVLGNDWFNDTKEEVEQFNYLFSNSLSLLGFIKKFENNEGKEDNLHVIFFNKEDIPQFKKIDLSLINEIDNSSKKILEEKKNVLKNN